MSSVSLSKQLAINNSVVQLDSISVASIDSSYSFMSIGSGLDLCFEEEKPGWYSVMSRYESSRKRITQREHEAIGYKLLLQLSHK